MHLRITQIKAYIARCCIRLIFLHMFGKKALLKHKVKLFCWSPTHLATYTYGSNSIKKVLPAVLKSSKFVENKYSKSIGAINVSSKNFDSNHIWLAQKDGEIVSPYKMLPSLFENMTEDEIEATLSELEDVSDGGAALTAYGKLQYTNMSNKEREELTKALKRYCELDTLAMVMIFEHLKSLV